jgi:hypothetical protein
MASRIRPADPVQKITEPHCLHLKLTPSHTGPDVSKYIERKFLVLKEKIHMRGPQTAEEIDLEAMLFDSAKAYLLKNAEGNFLWARLMTNDFDQDYAIPDIHALLKHICSGPPKVLSDIYQASFASLLKLQNGSKVDRDVAA